MAFTHPFILFIVFLVGCVLLVKASGWLVALLGWMARYLKVSEYSAAFLLMAAATSIPELFVGINAAVSGIPELSLGNVLGANLLNVTVVVGAIALFQATMAKGERAAHEAGITFTLALTPVILLVDGALSRADGMALVFLFFAYIRYLFVASRISGSAMNSIEPTPANFGVFIKKLFSFLGGIAILLLASRIVVFAAESGARVFGVPSFLIGFMVLSLGTTLPELTFGIRSAMRGHGSMGVGSAVGSVMFNSLFILGVVAMISPIAIAGIHKHVFVSFFAVIFIILFLHLVFRLFGRIPKSVGAALIFVYALAALYLFRLSFAG